jgi:hypothetical protein
VVDEPEVTDGLEAAATAAFNDDGSVCEDVKVVPAATGDISTVKRQRVG